MTDMKCPFCQQELDKVYLIPEALVCMNCHRLATKELWQELIRTRKALDIALDWLGQVATPAKCDDDLCREFTKRKLAEIKTALEQKESAFVHNKIEFPEYNDGLLEEFDKQFFENGQDDDLTETALEQKDVK